MRPSIVLERKVSFSSGHRYWLPGLSEEENRELFGRWASPFNHGHNYVLWVGAVGALERQTGMVVNIKRIDDLLQKTVVQRFDQKSINDEIPELHGVSPTLENLLLYFRRTLDDLPGCCRLNRLKLEEHPLLYGEWTDTKDMISITRCYEFAASHRLHSPLLSESENRRLYGKCTHPNGHGHNYALEVTVTGDVNPRTGMIADLEQLDRVVEEEILSRYDHKCLDLDVPELEGQVTTSEVVVHAIYTRLLDKVPATLHRVRLFETPRSCFEVVNEGA